MKQFLMFLMLAAVVILAPACISNDPRTQAHNLDDIVTVSGQYNSVHMNFNLAKGDNSTENKGGGQLSAGLMGDKPLEFLRDAAMAAMAPGATAAAKATGILANEELTKRGEQPPVLLEK